MNANSLFFMVTEGISTWAYIPQIMIYIKDRDSWSSISLKSWSIWSIGCVVKFWYVFSSHDVPLLKFYLAFDIMATLIVSLMSIIGRIDGKDLNKNGCHIKRKKIACSMKNKRDEWKQMALIDRMHTILAEDCRRADDRHRMQWHIDQRDHMRNQIEKAASIFCHRKVTGYDRRMAS